MLSQYNHDKAISWLEWLNKDEKAKSLIQQSIDKSLLFSGYTLEDYEDMLSSVDYCGDKTEVILSANSSQGTVIDACYMKYAKVCVLNFADYLHVGGKFLDGSMMQEECLCHISGLYPILNYFEDDYKERKGTSNYGAYQNTGVYSEDVPFYVNGKHVKCDVLTFAAVNYRIPMRSGNEYLFPQLEAAMQIRQRIAYLLPRLFGRCEEVILGAWGCGIFRNDPYKIAAGWKDCMELYPGLYRKVYHPIFKGGYNLQVFKEVFEN